MGHWTVGQWTWIWIAGMMLGLGFISVIGGHTVERPEEDVPTGMEPKQLTCGCCTNGCVCRSHQTFEKSINKCALHQMPRRLHD